MSILAIDPGSAESGWVAYEPHGFTIPPYGRVLAHGKWENARLLEAIRLRYADLHMQPFLPVGINVEVVIEQMLPRGMPFSLQAMETIWWAGQFAEAAWPSGVRRIPRSVVKMHLTGRNNSKDPEIRAALIDHFGGVGGKDAAIGRKASPGPLYGITADRWAALAVAVTFCDLEQAEAQNRTVAGA